MYGSEKVNNITIIVLYFYRIDNEKIYYSQSWTLLHIRIVLNVMDKINVIASPVVL